MSRKAKRKMRKRDGRWVHASAGVTLASSPWDHGATGPANRVGLVVEDRGEVDPKTGKMRNPNGVTGVRRVDLLEYWHKRGSISTEGFNAGEALRNAFEATMRSKPALPGNDRVQSSPKPDHAVDIMVDRISAFERIMRHVAMKDREIISACVLDNATPAAIRGYRGAGYRKGLAHLREALDRLADALGIDGKSK